MDYALFETKVRGIGISDNGERKMVEYNYLVKSMDFSGAEMATLVDVAPMLEDANCKAIKLSNVNEIVNEENNADGSKYYKVKVVMYLFDESTNRESKARFVYLVNATSPVEADNIIRAFMKECSYDVSDISETKIFAILNGLRVPKEDAE